MVTEEHVAGELVVRFEYETTRRDSNAPGQAYYNAFLKKASIEADFDSIRWLAVGHVL